jgi:hypothetical protein
MNRTSKDGYWLTIATGTTLYLAHISIDVFYDRSTPNIDAP